MNWNTWLKKLKHTLISLERNAQLLATSTTLCQPATPCRRTLVWLFIFIFFRSAKNCLQSKHASSTCALCFTCVSYSYIWHPAAKQMHFFTGFSFATWSSYFSDRLAIMFSIRHEWNILYDFRKLRHTPRSAVLSKSLQLSVKIGLDSVFVLCVQQLKPPAAARDEIMKVVDCKTNKVSSKMLKCSEGLMGLDSSHHYSPLTSHFKLSQEQLSGRVDIEHMMLIYF